jgi:hypothetical protein
MTKKAKPANYKTDWSKRDVGRLKACAMVGKSSREAAATLGRTPGAVRYKAMVERITFRSIKQPKGAQKKAQATIKANARKRSEAAKKGAATKAAKLRAAYPPA